MDQWTESENLYSYCDIKMQSKTEELREELRHHLVYQHAMSKLLNFRHYLDAFLNETEDRHTYNIVLWPELNKYDYYPVPDTASIQRRMYHRRYLELLMTDRSSLLQKFQDDKEFVDDQLKNYRKQLHNDRDSLHHIVNQLQTVRFPHQSQDQYNRLLYLRHEVWSLENILSSHHQQLMNLQWLQSNLNIHMHNALDVLKDYYGV